MNRIDELEAEVNDLENENAELQGQIDDLENELANAEDELETKSRGTGKLDISTLNKEMMFDLLLENWEDLTLKDIESICRK